MDFLQFILTVVIIVTAGGWCLDWIFSGTVHPIYVQSSNWSEDYKDSTITCRVCGHEVRYSRRKIQVDGEIKCDRCGSFLTEE